MIASKHMNRCSVSYAIKELWIKTALGHHCMLGEWPKSRKLTPPANWHSERGKTVETVRRWVVSRHREEGKNGWIGSAQRIFRGVCVRAHACVCVYFATPWTLAHQVHLSMEFSRQEYWSGLPFSSPRDLPDPRFIPESPALQAASLPSEPPGKPTYRYTFV